MAVVTARKFFSRFSTIEKVLTLNLLVALGFLATLWLHNHGVAYLVTIFGAAALFLPAFNLALTIEQLTERKEKLSIIFLWTTIFSLTITPAAVYFIGRAFFDASPALSPLEPFGIWWALTTAALFIIGNAKKIPPGFIDTRFDRRNSREVLILFLGFLTIMLINFVLYRYIPEADGYSSLLTLKQAQATPSVLETEHRIVYFVFLNLGAKLLAIDPYWVLKAVLPLFYLVTIVSVYLIAKPLIKQPSLRILAGLSPFFFPVVMQEALISRPQSIFAITLVPLLYLLGKITAERRDLRQLIWLGAIVVIGIIGLKIHTLFLFLILLGLVGIGILAWPYVKRFPLYAILFFELLLFAALPQLLTGSISYPLEYLARLLGSAISAGRVDWWFLDNYRNIDGAQIGWPGWSALLYYGYNIGIFAAVLAVAATLSKKVHPFRSIWQKSYWPIWTVLLLFLTVAEILPRLQLAFLPDRAWLFVALTTALLLPSLIGVITRPSNIQVKGLILVAGVLSLFVGSGLTYAKQGWVTPEEYRAAMFIKDNTPANAVFIGQGGNLVLIRYFAERALIRPDTQVFLGDDPRLAEQYVDVDKGEGYIIYSSNKFDTLYAQRDWWRTSNYYGANLDKFSQVYPVVYDRDGVTIWEVR